MGVLLEATPSVKSVIGKTYGHWAVLSYVGKKKHDYYVLCRCQCGVEKSVRVGHLLRGVSKSCGCKGLSLEKRFWTKVDKSTGPDDCWPWTGTILNDGYGQFWANRKGVVAHRLSYELHRGPIPDGLFVCHHCDNPVCVNPDHLFLGTQLDNMQDMISKGRRVHGHAHEKLTPTNVKEIRKRVTDGETQISLAKEFGVHPVTISDIITKRTWKNVK